MKNLLNEIFHGSWQPFRSKAPKQNQRDERTNDQEHQRPGITVRRRRGILRRVCIRLDDDGIVIQNMNFLFHVFGLARQGSPGRRGERIFHKNRPDCDRKPMQTSCQTLSLWWRFPDSKGLVLWRGSGLAGSPADKTSPHFDWFAGCEQAKKQTNADRIFAGSKSRIWIEAKCETWPAAAENGWACQSVF